MGLEEDKFKRIRKVKLQFSKGFMSTLFLFKQILTLQMNAKRVLLLVNLDLKNISLKSKYICRLPLDAIFIERISPKELTVVATLR